MMKKSLSLCMILLLIAAGICAQSPQSFKYQTVVRDLSGATFVNQDIMIRISILKGDVGGSSVYGEIHEITTNAFGLATLEIGNGTLESGDFSSIEWGMDRFFLKVEADFSGGSTYELLGTTQLLSVPFAMHSTTAERFITLTDEARDQMIDVPVGKIIYNATTNRINLFDGLHWIELEGECLPKPTTPDAGFDQYNVEGATTVLSANLPLSGTGSWVIKNGEGGYLHDPDNPATAFSGLENTVYVLSWVISNECSSKADDVSVHFGPFNCGLSVKDGRDDNVYNTVLIGGQCWMAENINIGVKIDGLNSMTNNGLIEKYCYANDELYCDQYGGLYQWAEMMQYTTATPNQGICMPGWHLPTDGEWKILEGTVDTEFPVGDAIWDNTGYRGLDAAGNLKEQGTANWVYPNTGATNSSGFAALPAASRNTDGSYPGLGIYGRFWTATESGTDGLRRNMESLRADISRSGGNKLFGMSVRCIKD